MTRYHGGETVRRGFYLNRRSWELESIAKENDLLPGDSKARYVRVPVPAVVLAGPLFGLAYVILLPVILSFGFAYFFARWVAKKLGSKSRAI